jgi:hypothetical protein
VEAEVYFKLGVFCLGVSILIVSFFAHVSPRELEPGVVGFMKQAWPEGIALVLLPTFLLLVVVAVVRQLKKRDGWLAVLEEMCFVLMTVSEAIFFQVALGFF